MLYGPVASKTTCTSWMRGDAKRAASSSCPATSFETWNVWTSPSSPFQLTSSFSIDTSMPTYTILFSLTFLIVSSVVQRSPALDPVVERNPSLVHAGITSLLSRF